MVVRVMGAVTIAGFCFDNGRAVALKPTTTIYVQLY
jgi:hypothetical protein